MSAGNSTPYGVKSLLECMCRATLLAQPDDIPEFMSTYVDKMAHFRDEDSRDIKEVAYRYQEQWGKSEWYFDSGIHMQMKWLRLNIQYTTNTDGMISYG